MKLMPSSRARWIMRRHSSWSVLPQAPNIMAPKQSELTSTPVRPRTRYSMGANLVPRCGYRPRGGLFGSGDGPFGGVALGPQLPATLPERRLPDLEAAAASRRRGLLGLGRGLASDIVGDDGQDLVVEVLVVDNGD